MLHSCGRPGCLHWSSVFQHAKHDVGDSGNKDITATWLVMVAEESLKGGSPGFCPPTQQEVHAEQVPWPEETKFLLFTPWPGYWNNVRISFETATYTACLLNRTLLIPRLRLQSDNYVADAKMQLTEAYDMELFGRHFPYIGVVAFVRQGGINFISHHDGYPTLEESKKGHTQGKRPLETLSEDYCSNLHSMQSRYCYMYMPMTQRSWYKEMKSVNESYNPNYFAHPDGQFLEDPTPRWHRTRNPLPVDDTRKLIHIDGLLMIYYNFAYVPRDDPRGKMCRQRMIDGVQYNQQIRHWASRFVEELGGVDGFSAVHLRRSDFKTVYTESIADPTAVMLKLGNDLRKGETFLIATDEEDVVRKELRFTAGSDVDEVTGYRKFDFKIVFVSEIPSYKEMQQQLRPGQWAPVSQLVMAQARMFYQNDLSSFSAYTVRLRILRGEAAANNTKKLVATPDIPYLETFDVLP